jgi:hypothetical protein
VCVYTDCVALMETQTVQRGAGSILHSNLAKSGYKLPCLYILTEEEEKRIYDIEVRLRLGHDDCIPLLLDILLDIPYEGLVSNTSLIEAVLDLVGGIRFDVDSSDGAETSKDISEYRLTPVFGLRWCVGLLRSMQTSFDVVLRGSLCSLIPSFGTDEQSNRNPIIPLVCICLYSSLPCRVLTLCLG